MNTETFLNEINWTGLTLAQLCEAGRMTQETVKRWIDESRNAELESLDFEGVENHDFRAELDARIRAVEEISKKFDLQ